MNRRFSSHIEFWVAILTVLFLGIAAVGGYYGWQQRKFAGYSVQCRELMKAKEWEQLQTLAKEWVVQQPEKAEPWIFLAEAAQNQGDLQGAADYLRQLPPGDPKSLPAMLELASVLFGALNKPLEAEQIYHRILEIEPRVPTAHERLIFFYAVTMQRGKLQRQIERCIESNCDTPETYVYRFLIGSDWNVFSNAHELLGLWLTAAPSDEVFQVPYALHVVKANNLEDRIAAEKTASAPVGDENAELAKEFGERLASLIETYPRNIELLVFLLNQASANGDVDRVAHLLEQAPTDAVSDNRLWRYKGWFHAAQGELPQAESAFRESLRLNPYDWGARHQLADVLRRTRRPAEAELAEQLSVQGKALREKILELPDVRSAPPALLQEIALYAAACGDSLVADRLYRRLQGQPPSR